MVVVFVTGVSGSGKSTLARTMAGWGHRTVSTDADPRLCYWSDSRGCPVQRPAEPDATWLTTHEWRWNPRRLDEIITGAANQSDDPLWLFGQAANAAEFADRFDVTILLEIDQQTMISRIQNGSRGNDLGRVGDSLSIALASYIPFVTAWRRHGAVIVDGTADVETVAEELLMAAASAALHRRKPSG
ncbi:hypothetical protein Raf01_94410 [Rugosimonospora africana]|uniref:Uncharacterized protein n=2 Tax=Rugosimonospora africana TaxID=556532 RepID=A0A8J3R3S2_9ACTN|nr:hypothetical protein Raf01_94410 [Rugosimonospora africana]